MTKEQEMEIEEKREGRKRKKMGTTADGMKWKRIFRRKEDEKEKKRSDQKKTRER